MVAPIPMIREDRDDLHAAAERAIGLSVTERRFVQLDPLVDALTLTPESAFAVRPGH
jgi:hypothetical protein